MKKKWFKKISLILLGSTAISSFSGCAKSEDEQIIYDIDDSKIDETFYEDNNLTLEENNDTERIDDVINNEDNNEYKNDNELVEEFDIKSYFYNSKEEIKELINKDSLDKAKEKAINLFIDMTDFIFYGKEIHGVTYSQLSSELKKNIVDTFIEVDDILNSFFPDYKENLEKKYAEIATYLKENIKEVKQKFKNDYGDVTINDILNAIEDVKESDQETIDNLKEYYDEGKEKVKTWYEDFKDKH